VRGRIECEITSNVIHQMDSSREFDAAVNAVLAHSATYASDLGFVAIGSGSRPEARNMRASSCEPFGELVGSVYGNARKLAPLAVMASS